MKTLIRHPYYRYFVPALLLLAAMLGASYLLGARLLPQLEQLSTLQLGVLASLIAGLFTALGALPIFFIQQLNKSLEDSLLGFGAGVMLAATAFELVLPAQQQAEALFASDLVTLAMLGGGLALGGGLLYLLHQHLPHRHFMGGPDTPASVEKIKGIWLFVFAIGLHNLPEGLAVGAGFGGDNLTAGLALAIGIGLQNLPEGLIVALALLSLGHNKAVAFAVSLLTGLVQPLGGLLGAWLVSLVDLLLPFVLSLAAGAMLFVISHEIIPESHRLDNKSQATLGVLLGFIVMLGIDIVLE
ncbi:ZIP family metal transporter [Marinospirillum perlucidum]|uniref:ZIP family metal transporter n=1 Tax=Marinospirillum perlucidum TaxID=1982602 RepID=UPI000DF26350|nr:ZIP family metal transporter [Marinospirillum perlucidum]